MRARATVTTLLVEEMNAVERAQTISRCGSVMAKFQHHAWPIDCMGRVGFVRECVPQPIFYAEYSRLLPRGSR